MENGAPVRKASSADLPQIAKVHVDVWRSTYRGIVPQEYLDQLSYEARTQMWQKRFIENPPRSHILVATDEEGDVIGFSCGGPNRDSSSPYEGEVYAIYLRNEFHGRGIGKKLFLSSLQELLRDGYTKSMVWVLESNPTRKFYEAMGGRHFGEKWDDIGGKKLLEIGLGWLDIKETLKSEITN